MTLLSEASFLLTPNGYKASKLYQAIPTNGNGDMTVTRATTATRVDENDLVSSVASNVPRIDYTGGGCPSILLEPQRTNLFPYSEDLTQWVITRQIASRQLVANPLTGVNNATKITRVSVGSDPYVGQLKSRFIELAPAHPVVDLMHEVPDFNAHAGAHLLAAFASSFPVGSVFLAVVDPGVGTERNAVVMNAGGRWFVGPDNGLLSIIAARHADAQYWKSIVGKAFSLHHVSSACFCTRI